MIYYPLFVELQDRPCLVVGGGEIALRKTKPLLERGTAVEVVAPEVVPELAELIPADNLHRRKFNDEFCRRKFLVIAATDSAELNEQVAAAARQHGALVNVVDNPELSDFIAAAVLRRGQLQIAISTGGSSPGLAALIRAELEEEYDPDYGTQLERLEELRELIKANVDNSRTRKKILNQLAATFHELSGDNKQQNSE